MRGEASQNFVPIKTIRDGILEVEGGEYRAILMTNSLNLSLKSEDEQFAVISQFQNFLNSLDFPIQVFVKSRRMNLEPYLELLKGRIGEVKEELLKLQILEYIEYIKSFSEERNIMTKYFFVVVPYVPAIVNLKDGLFGGKKDNFQEQAKSFKEIERQMDERVSVVTGGLSRCGLKVSRLSTEDSIELFHGLFNPGDAEKAVNEQ
jgi:hypothetical protein